MNGEKHGLKVVYFDPNYSSARCPQYGKEMKESPTVLPLSMRL
ncbi:transposase [Metallosphaera tengchongensis]|nr:transposase [Metallosphaera tengchongensis]